MPFFVNRRSVLALIFFGLLFTTITDLPKARADEQTSLESQVKAAYLANFVKFVEWPPHAFADSRSPLVIGVLGENPLSAALEEAIKNQNINGRALVLKTSLRVEELRSCHLLFISRSEIASLSQILESLKDTNVLTVSDMDSFAQMGGMICLIKKENKIRFEINKDAAQHADLKISSKLLSLAETIIGSSNNPRT